MNDLDHKYRAKDITDFLLANGWEVGFDSEAKPSKLGVRGMQKWSKGLGELFIYADGDCELYPSRGASQVFTFRLRVIRAMMRRLREAK